jgi:ubiquinone/menaquinone biosynthesis C-methylase UbiE
MSAVLERVSSQAWVPAWIRHQHIARYQWASEHCRNRRVIEVACGTGYGAAILSGGGAESVDGFDASEEALREAQASPAVKNVAFRLGNAMHLPVANASYDLFLSLETIEHIEDDRAFLKEVARVLRPNGVFICSTPNRAMTNPGTTISQHPFNPYHLREYTQAELNGLLRPFFGQIEFFGQSAFGAQYQQALSTIGKRAPAFAVKLHQLRKLLGLPWENFQRHWPRPVTSTWEPEILLALCSQPRS